LSGITGDNETVLYTVASESKLGIGWEGHVLGRYMIGIILLGERQKGTSGTKRTYSSCLRSPFRCTSTLMQYSISHENEDDHEAEEGGSGFEPPFMRDGNGMENGNHVSAGANSSRGGQERTTEDVTRLRVTCSAIKPLSEAITLTLPKSCQNISAARCVYRLNGISTETSTRTTWVHFSLSLTAPCTIPLNP